MTHVVKRRNVTILSIISANKHKFMLKESQEILELWKSLEIISERDEKLKN